MFEAVLSLGSNLGDREFYLKSAVEDLKNIPGIELVSISSVYETEPFGVSGSQGKYLNCCVLIKTSLPPFALLGVCLGIETKLGRQRPYRFAPRTIDIDIIFYENEIINDENLTLPHPRMGERAFVLVPMMDILPEGKFKSFDFGNKISKCDNLSIIKININI